MVYQSAASLGLTVSGCEGLTQLTASGCEGLTQYNQNTAKCPL